MSFQIGTTTPFVGIQDESIIYNGKLYATRRFIIQGKVGDNCQFDVIKEVSNFARRKIDGFQSLNLGGFEVQNARCESFSILNSNAFGLEYSAEFLEYPEEWFSEIVRVADPIDTININENKDGSISVVRRISGRGIADTPGDAISKVEDWIKSLKIDNIPILSDIIDDITPPPNIKPSSIRQTFNRLEGSISVEVEFRFNQNATSSTFLEISVEASEDKKEGSIVITVSGTLSGPADMEIQALRDEFKKIPIGQLASSAIIQPVDVNKVLSTSLDEDELNNTITFSFVYNNMLFDKLTLSETTVEHDCISDIRTISINGTSTFQKKHQLDRKENISKLTSFDPELPDACQQEYNKYFPNVTNPPVFTIPKSYNLTVNSSDFSSNFNVSFDDSSIIPQQLEDKVFEFNYTIDYTPSIEIKNPIQILDGSQKIMNVKAKTRGEISIQGTAKSKEESLENIILGAADSIITDLKSSEQFSKETLQKWNCSSTKDTTVQYDFEIQYSAETKLYKS
jgi:hypothetical protein